MILIIYDLILLFRLNTKLIRDNNEMRANKLINHRIPMNF